MKYNFPASDVPVPEPEGFASWLVSFSEICLKPFSFNERLDRLINFGHSKELRDLYKSKSIHSYEQEGLEKVRETSLNSYSEKDWSTVPLVTKKIVFENLKEEITRIETLLKTKQEKTKMAITVDFDEHRSYDSDDRPYIEVILKKNTSGIKDVNLWCLIDTGADYLQIHESFASDLGIDLAVDGSPLSVMTSSGASTTITEISVQEIEIEGNTFDTKCYFGLNSIPIIGRNTILSLLELGFDTNGWLFKI
jgi:predicted aspartyl protease